MLPFSHCNHHLPRSVGARHEMEGKAGNLPATRYIVDADVRSSRSFFGINLRFDAKICRIDLTSSEAMGSMNTPESFPLLTTLPPSSTISTLPPFTVSIPRGFLPLSDPPTKLPASFAALSSLLARMPMVTIEGKLGLLASFTFGETVLRELPDLTENVDEVKKDLRMVCALYRDYSFVASAYLLEPCHERWVRSEGYGLGRQRLPACIARPLAKVAEM